MLLSSNDGWQIEEEATLSPEEIIRNLRLRPNLQNLNLCHIALGGEGSKVLFRWLAYGDDDDVHEASHDCPSLPLLRVTNINLTAARLGNVGLSALVGWLECLKKSQERNISISPSSTPAGLRGLFLQNNFIDGTSELALSLVSALSFHNTEPPYIFPSLSYLNLSNNPLSSEFKQTFFSSLASLPSLRRLLLSMTGLNPTDADAIAAYIGQCRLTEFNASANNIGFRGLKKIIKAVKQCPTLESVSIYANDGDMGDNDRESSDDEEERPRNPDQPREDQRTGWRRLLLGLDLILSQNLYMKYIVRHQALELLFYSRLLLLNQRSAHGRSHSEPDLLVELVAKEAPHHSSCSNHKHNCECLPTFRNSHPDPSVPIDDAHASNSHFPFTRLPTEIQLMILSQLAPILSSSQQIRIFEYAIDKTTLPDLSLRLPSSNGTSHKTASSGAGPGFFGSTYLAQRSRSFATMNVTFIPDMTEKEKWLELAGCDAYDPNP